MRYPHLTSVVRRACSTLVVAAHAAAAQTPAPLPADLDRFYTSPSLIGTTPRGMTWSPTGPATVAFLWNEDGTNFLDVYVASVSPGRVPSPPRRVTSMPRPRADAGARPAGETPLAYTRWQEQRAMLAAELDGGVSGFAWHPDGRRLLVTFRGDLWLVTPWIAAPTGDVRRLTSSSGAESRAAFAPRTARPPGAPGPSGAMVAWIRDGDVHVATLAGDSLAGERRLTTLARDGVGVEAFAWSSDGAQLMLVEVDRTQIRTRGIPDYLTDETTMPMVRRAMPGEPSEIRRVGIIGAAGGAITWLPVTTDRFDVLHGWQWSPDGRRLVLDVSDVFVKHRRIVVADLSSGTSIPGLRTLIEERDSANVTAEWQVAWAPDGRGLYFTSDRRDDYHVWYAPLDGSAPRQVTSGDFAVFAFTVTPRALFVTSNAPRPEERHLWRVPLLGGAATRLTRDAGTHAAVVSPQGDLAADLFSSDTIPPDLYVLDLARGDDRGVRVTTSPHPDLARYRFTPARYVTFASRADGAPLHARLLIPPHRREGERLPLIVGSAYSNTVRNQWGGRNAHPLWGLDQVLLEKGFAILAVDVAGSSGHGTAFRRRIRLDYGGIDVEDLHSGVEWAVREGIADSTRVGIWGSSYGGLLTTMSLFTKPTVFKAGVAGAPATNVWHALTGEQRVMLRPQEHMAEYADASSHTKAPGMQGHLMLIHGMRDVVVLYKDSAWLTQYLLQLGKDVELVTLPDAGHGWDLEGASQTRFAFRQLVRFFEQHLK